MASPPEQIESKPCRLLDKLSAELRNEIWELAFTPDHSENEEVELFKAKPPQRSLILTCNQIRNQAKGFYVDAYRSYWRTTTFVVNFPQTRFRNVESAHFSGQDVDQITQLQAIWGHGSPLSTTYTFVHDYGSWIVPSSPGFPYPYMQLRHIWETGRIIAHFNKTGFLKQPLHKQLVFLIMRYDNEIDTEQRLRKQYLDWHAQWGALHQTR